MQNESNREAENMDIGDLMQVLAKDVVESAIRKENSGRFRLEHSSSLLEGHVCSQLGMSGEKVLADEILSNQENLDE